MTANRIHSKRPVFSTDWFSVVEKRRTEADDAPYFVLELSDYVAVVALTRQNELVLVRQYRPAVEREMLELPCGHVDPGEDARDAAARELREETGYVADTLELMSVTHADTGRLDNRLWCFFANVHFDGDGWQPEPGLDVVVLPLTAILRSLAAGKPMLGNAHCIAAIGLALAQKRF